MHNLFRSIESKIFFDCWCVSNCNFVLLRWVCLFFCWAKFRCCSFQVYLKIFLKCSKPKYSLISYNIYLKFYKVSMCNIKRNVIHRVRNRFFGFISVACIGPSSSWWSNTMFGVIMNIRKCELFESWCLDLWKTVVQRNFIYHKELI